MDFRLFGVVVIFVCMMATHGFAKSLPDSAGIVPQPKGLAYGGIPYGSISGQLSLYFGNYDPIILTNKVSGSDIQQL